MKTLLESLTRASRKEFPHEVAEMYQSSYSLFEQDHHDID